MPMLLVKTYLNVNIRFVTSFLFQTLPYRNHPSASTEMTEINEDRGVDSQTGEDHVSLRMPNVTHNVKIISNDLVLPGRNSLAEIHPESEESVSSNEDSERLEYGRRATSNRVEATAGEIKEQRLPFKQGQSSRDTSINVPLSQYERFLEQGQSSQAKKKPNLSKTQSPANQSNLRPAAQRDRNDIGSNGNASNRASAVNQSGNASEPQDRTTRKSKANGRARAENRQINRNETRTRNVSLKLLNVTILLIILIRRTSKLS